MAEPPYGVIWKCMKGGDVVPFLGAGASFVGRPPDARWDAKQPAFLPSGRELSNFLAQETSFPSMEPVDRNDLAKVSSYYADISGRRRLRGQLREILNRDYQYGELHRFLASVPSPQVIVVTNYDTLLEQAFRDAERPYDLVVYPADSKEFANAVLWWPHGQAEPNRAAPNELDIDLAQTTVIYKMHGTVQRETEKWDNFVVTEEDYIEFLSRMTANTAVPALFTGYFRERSFLFLGYSLSDWNLRVILKNLSKLFSRKGDADEGEKPPPSWAIQFKPSELECKLWERRDVSIFDQTIDEFVAKLKECRGDKECP